MAQKVVSAVKELLTLTQGATLEPEIARSAHEDANPSPTITMSSSLGAMTCRSLVHNPCDISRC